MLGQILRILQDRGYVQISEDANGILYRETENIIYVVTLSDVLQNLDNKQYSAIQRKVEFMLATKLHKRVELLHVVATEDGMFEQREFHLTDHLTNVWFVAKDTGKVYVFEHQISDFDELYNLFDDELTKYVERVKKERTFTVTPVNMGIVFLNVLFFVIVILVHGDFYAVYDSEIMLSMGALSYDTFVSGAWYQIVTSFFLHFGISHLLNNMVLLTYVGCELERRIGSVSYLLIYFGAGIIGNIVSLLYYNTQGQQVVSAGASGAIFGVIGALLIFLVVRHVKTPNLSPVRLFVMAGITIYYGITSAGVDNAAHIGGFLAGIISGFLLSKISRYGKLE